MSPFKAPETDMPLMLLPVVLALIEHLVHLVPIC